MTVPPSDITVRILLADGHSLFRDAVRRLLESEDGFEVVAEAREGLQAVEEAERFRPGVALIDADLPNCDGIRATKLIVERVPECHVLVVAAAQDDHTLVSALEAGASGFISKDSPLAELIDATRAIGAGEVRIPPKMLGTVLGVLIRRRRQHDDAFRLVSLLTRREREVLRLVATGAGNDDVAQELVISPETARTHIQNALGKLGVHSRLEAVAFVVKHGILDELAGRP